MKKPIEGTIEEVIIEPEKIQPVIVNFQNGTLKDEEVGKMKCGVFFDPKTKKDVLGLSNGQICYKGCRPDFSKDVTYTMLAIRNKVTGKIRLIQAERWDVAPILDKKVVDDGVIGEDKLLALNKQFGSKKTKRRTQQFEKMKVNMESVREDLEKTVANVEIAKEDLVPELSDDFLEGNMLPKCNKEATDVTEIYNWKDIIPEEVLETLYPYTEPGYEFNESKPKYFEDTLAVLHTQSNYQHKVALLLYMEAISKWLNIPIKLYHVQHTKEKICPLSKEIANYVVENFSVASKTRPNERLRPNHIRDKAIIHCMIIGFLIGNYKINIEQFTTLFSVRLGVKKFLDLARYTYAVTNKGDKNTVILKLPLPNTLDLFVNHRKRRR